MITLLHSPPPRLLLLPYSSIPWVEALLFLLPICVHMWKDQRLRQLQKCCRSQNGATDLDSFLLVKVLPSSQCQGLLSIRICEEGWWSCCLMCTQYGVWILQSLAMYLLLFSSFFFSMSRSSVSKGLWRRLMILLSVVYPMWSLNSAELGNVPSSSSSFFFSMSRSSFNKDLWRRLMILLSLVYPIWSLESAELGNVSSSSCSSFFFFLLLLNIKIFFQ